MRFFNNVYQMLKLGAQDFNIVYQVLKLGAQDFNIVYQVLKLGGSGFQHRVPGVEIRGLRISTSCTRC